MDPNTHDELPPEYSDVADNSSNASTIVRVPISAVELELHDQDHPEIANPLAPVSGKKAWHSRFSLNSPDPTIRFVPMTRADRTAYWAKDTSPNAEKHSYLPHVTTPPGGRKAWVKQQLELDAQWREAMLAQDPAQRARKSPLGMAKYTASNAAQVGFVALTGPIGIGAVYAGDKMKQKKKKAKDEVET